MSRVILQLTLLLCHMALFPRAGAASSLPLYAWFTISLLAFEPNSAPTRIFPCTRDSILTFQSISGYHYCIFTMSPTGKASINIWVETKRFIDVSSKISWNFRTFFFFWLNMHLVDIFPSDLQLRECGQPQNLAIIHNTFPE